ncbi:MAG: hypothetical protein K940chlam1_01263 [Candidatus Anoxychlamydiales bacterium]|nr:hypothetical protein [Candidatus Anoxychlamydiales bacterium]NGX35314.1 hypothetical protein [Candidatus Anoxychlamydiales bacterium]
MSHISSLKTLSKRAVLNHPKLKFDDPKGYCQEALITALDSEIALSIIKEALENPRIKNYQIIYDSQELGFASMDNDKICIVLGKKGGYYHTQASVDEIPKNYSKHFKPDELKKIAGLFTIDQILVHEFNHAKNSANNLAASKTCSQKDMDSEEERVTILYIESAYLGELKKPSRVDHRESEIAGYQKILKNKYALQLKLQVALDKYLMNGLHVDAIKVTEKLTNNEIEQVLCWIDPSMVASEYFLEIVLALIEEKDLNINFSDPNWTALLNACLRHIPTYEQFNKLENLGADKEMLLDRRGELSATLKEKIEKISNNNFNRIIKLTSAFSDIELVRFLQIYASDFSAARYFLDMMLFLINDRKLDINFDDPIYKKLFNICTRSIKDIKQFKNFRKVLSKKSQEKLDRSPNHF